MSARATAFLCCAAGMVIVMLQDKNVARVGSVLSTTTDQAAPKLPEKGNLFVELSPSQTEDKTFVGEFAWRNSTKSDLRMVKVESSCGCIVVDFPQDLVVRPASIVHIRVQLNSGDRIGLIDGQLVLAAKNETGETIKEIVQVAAFARPELGVLAPDEVTLRDFVDAKAASVALNLVGRKGDLDMVRFEHNGNILPVSFSSTVALHDRFQDLYRREVSLSINDLLDAGMDWIDLHSSGRKKKIRLTYDSVNAVRASPQVIQYPVGLGIRNVPKKIAFTHRVPIQFRADDGDPAVSVEILSESKLQSGVTITTVLCRLNDERMSDDNPGNISTRHIRAVRQSDNVELATVPVYFASIDKP